MKHAALNKFKKKGSDQHKNKLHGQVVNSIEFMHKNTFVLTSYEGCFSDEWKECNEVGQWSVTSGIIFNFYLITDGDSETCVYCSSSRAVFTCRVRPD